ncbi:MAG: hypothetical protein ACXAB7_04625 [Candidatus Kariarchaeaceae archaeon]
MLTVHLYGKLRKLAANPNPAANSTVQIPFKSGESLKDCIERLGIRMQDTGELFINHILSESHEVIPRDESRLGIFPHTMKLIDGGLYLRYCGTNSSDHK